MIGTRLFAGLLAALFGLAACSGEATAPPATAVVISKELATAFLSPTPDADQMQGTRRASTAAPPTPTSPTEPSATPYVGVFIGQAPQDVGLRRFTAPLFADESEIAAGPTVDPGRCATPVDVTYEQVWRTRPEINERLGCPIQEAFGFFGEAQTFENGVIYRRPDTRELWAIPAIDGRGIYRFLEAPPDISATGISAPPGLRLPEDDFLGMWVSVSGLRDQLGYAVTEPQEIAMGIQRFTGGSFLLDGNIGQIYGLVVDGTVLGPYAAPETITPGVAETPTATDTTSTPEDDTPPDTFQNANSS